MNVDGALPSLFAARPASTGSDHRLATAHAPILLFDSREPFLPLAVGYTIFRKHAFAPTVEVFLDDAERIRHLCTERAGSGGLHIAPLFEQLLSFKTPEVDNMVHAFLQRHAFEPSYVFSKSYIISTEILVPWVTLHKWIPNRLARIIKELR